MFRTFERNYMKQLIFCLILVFGLATSQAQGPSSQPDTTISIPSEISALLASTEFSNIIRNQSTTATQSGRELRIVSLNVIKVGSHTYAAANLATKVKADIASPWSASGTIIGNIVYGPTGEASTDGVYYKPEGELPGGASVGNN